jgi:hypothetical protein
MFAMMIRCLRDKRLTGGKEIRSLFITGQPDFYIQRLSAPVAAQHTSLLFAIGYTCGQLTLFPRAMLIMAAGA